MTAGVRQDDYNVFGEATTYRVTGGYIYKETGSKLRRLEEELASLQDARVSSAEHAKATQAAVAAALNSAAERIETITRRLNQTIGDGGVPMG